MGIPNNDTFSLQDVADYLEKSGEDNLVGLFDAAQDDEFDPNYEGNQDRLSNFRNYAGVWVGKLVPVVAVSLASDDEWKDESDTVRADVVGHDVKEVDRWSQTSKIKIRNLVESSWRGNRNLIGPAKLTAEVIEFRSNIGHE